MSASVPKCSLCKPHSYNGGVCDVLKFACGHAAHADCQIIKWLPSCCFACRCPLAKKEKIAISEKFEEGLPDLAEILARDAEREHAI